jgi:cell division transport system permease protein
VPGVIELRLASPRADPGADRRPAAAAVRARWSRRMASGFARLAALGAQPAGLAWPCCCWSRCVAAAVVAVATRAGPRRAARRDRGAARPRRAGWRHRRRFARRVGLLAAGGAALGTALAVPALALLSDLAAPWLGAEASGGMSGALVRLPWPALLRLPPIAFLLGWGTAQATVRRWLRALP